MEVLQCFGFSVSYRAWVKVIFNGLQRVTFGIQGVSVRGILLSLLLFGLADEFLGHYLSFLMKFRALDQMASPHGVTALTHLLYTDDVLFSFSFLAKGWHNLITVVNFLNMVNFRAKLRFGVSHFSTSVL